MTDVADRILTLLPKRAPGELVSVLAAKLGVPLRDVQQTLADLETGAHVVGVYRRGVRRWHLGIPRVDPAPPTPQAPEVATLFDLATDPAPDPTDQPAPESASTKLVDAARDLFTQLAQLGDDERMDVINEIRLALAEHSPMRREPVDCVLWVEQDAVQANDYNPNVVAPPEMRLLQMSVMADGFTQPIVTWPAENGYEVVDGFHRTRVAKEVGAVRKRTRGRIPITVINPERTAKEDRIAATIRHNRARGVHQVDAMSDIVLDLARRNWSDERIGKELGMQPDEVLRLKQVSGLADLFADRDFSEAWEA